MLLVELQSVFNCSSRLLSLEAVTGHAEDTTSHAVPEPVPLSLRSSLSMSAWRRLRAKARHVLPWSSWHTGALSWLIGHSQQAELQWDTLLVLAFVSFISRQLSTGRLCFFNKTRHHACLLLHYFLWRDLYERRHAISLITLQLCLPGSPLNL